MFDFLKDVYLEAQGLDMEMVREERKAKIELEKSETILLSKNTKKYIIVAGIIFLIIHIASMVLSSAIKDVGGLLKSAIMCMITFAAIICLIVKSKQTEIAGIVCAVIVVLLSFIIPLF